MGAREVVLPQGLPPQPGVAVPLTHVGTYLCLSLMSTGLHTEPYRVSCHR